MKPLFSVLVVAAVLLFFVLAFDMMKKGAKKESFDNSGALMQLSADHVPTREDVGEMRQYRRQVRQDLMDMTGGY